MANSSLVLKPKSHTEIWRGVTLKCFLGFVLNFLYRKTPSGNKFVSSEDETVMSSRGLLFLGMRGALGFSASAIF